MAGLKASHYTCHYIVLYLCCVIILLICAFGAPTKVRFSFKVFVCIGMDSLKHSEGKNEDQHLPGYHISIKTF